LFGFRRTQFIPELGLFYNEEGILLGGVSDLWRISGCIRNFNCTCCCLKTIFYRKRYENLFWYRNKL